MAAHNTDRLLRRFIQSKVLNAFGWGFTLGVAHSYAGWLPQLKHK